MNCIRKIENLENCTNLRHLDLSHNEIRSCDGIANLPYLTNVILDGNFIMRPDNIWPLIELPMLSTLNLLDNPLVVVGDTRLAIVFRFPRLAILNNEVVSPEEKISSINVYNPPRYVTEAIEHAEMAVDKIWRNPLSQSLQRLIIDQNQ